MHSPEQSTISPEMLSQRDVVAISHEFISYGFEPGNPESRLPLEDATEMMNAVGLGGEVYAELRLGDKSESGPSVPTEKGDGIFNVWLVKGEKGDFVLFNADAVKQVAKSGKNASEAFLEFYAKELPVNEKVVLGRKGVSLGMETVSGSEKEDIDYISRSHVEITIHDHPSNAGLQIEINDISTNGTTIERGPKEGASSELIDTVPSFETAEQPESESSSAKEQQIADLETELNDSRFDQLKALYNRRDRYLNEKRVAQKAGNGQVSMEQGQFAGQVSQEIRSDYSALDAEYNEIQRKLHDLKSE